MILTKYVNHALFYRLSKMHNFFGTIKQYKMHDIGEGRFYSHNKIRNKRGDCLKMACEDRRSC